MTDLSPQRSDLGFVLGDQHGFDRIDIGLAAVAQRLPQFQRAGWRRAFALSLFAADRARTDVVAQLQLAVNAAGGDLVT